MANEIIVTSSLQVTNGNMAFPKVGSTEQTINQSTLGGCGPGFLSIGTSIESVTVTDVSNKGWTYIKNLDATNYIEYGPESGTTMATFGRLLAGEACVLRLSPAITLQMQANTAACKVQIHCFET